MLSLSISEFTTGLEAFELALEFDDDEVELTLEFEDGAAGAVAFPDPESGPRVELIDLFELAVASPLEVSELFEDEGAESPAVVPAEVELSS